MSEVDWEAARTVVMVLSAICAVVAATVSVLILREARSNIAEGDASVKAHADRSLSEISDTVDEMSGRLNGVRDAVARIEAHQESEEKHVLRPRDLGAIHEKVNRVAEELAATRAQSTTQTQMLSEQLRLLQRLVQDNARSARYTQ